ncbi:MAG: 8-amino-7-oxononanoate synthase, partial [Halothiobacillaceae bacterium]
MRDLAAELTRRRGASLYRQRQVVESPQGVHLQLEGSSYLSFCSNDYLGLANHPAVVAALQEGASRYGVGSGSAHLVSGHSQAHHRLEEELAAFVGYERALLFSTGYMANLGVISALMGRTDLVLEDRLNHASLLDGARLSQARLQRYPHNDIAVLARQLAENPQSERMVVTDGVFSMEGDLAP